MFHQRLLFAPELNLEVSSLQKATSANKHFMANFERVIDYLIKFGLFVDFEFLMEMGSWGTDYLIPVGLRKILQRKVVENGVRK